MVTRFALNQMSPFSSVSVTPSITSSLQPFAPFVWSLGSLAAGTIARATRFPERTRSRCRCHRVCPCRGLVRDSSRLYPSLRVLSGYRSNSILLAGIHWSSQASNTTESEESWDHEEREACLSNPSCSSIRFRGTRGVFKGVGLRCFAGPNARIKPRRGAASLE